MQVAEGHGPIVLDESYLNSFRQKLLEWQEPFTLNVGTLAGVETSVQVVRTTTVAVLCGQVSQGLNVKGYRLTLASTDSNHKLEPPSATLEELGVCCDQSLAAFFGKIDRWQELSIPEFLELATSLGALQEKDAAQKQQAFDCGKLKREEVQSQALIGLIERKEEALRKTEAAKKKKAEEERLQRENVKRDLLREASSASTVKEGCEKMAAQKCAYRDEIVAEAKIFRQEIKASLDEALPPLHDAMKALDMLSKRDVQELRAIASPPGPIKVTMQALCILFRVLPMRVRDYEGRMVEDYWQPSMRLMSSENLLNDMKNFDKDNIPPEVIRKLERVLPNEDFQPERVRKCSIFCAAACSWVNSIYQYHLIAQKVAPERAILMGKEEILQQLQLEQDILAEILREA